MLGKIVAISMTGAIVLLAVLLETTKPATIGPLGILLVFILMYVSVLGVLTFLLYGCSRVVARATSTMIVRRPIEPLTLGRSYYYASVLSLAPILFVGMQSVGEVSIYDVFLVLLFVTIACIYIAKRTR
ncbi:MAG TPA: hypothetical protein VLG36_02105 [Candidatus Chromulinivoraceae bacterium]|nr:hypothetical protein [Candidatus Chromulinivoraceae bacterium]